MKMFAFCETRWWENHAVGMKQERKKKNFHWSQLALKFDLKEVRKT